jgi:hypothetical protein
MISENNLGVVGTLGAVLGKNSTSIRVDGVKIYCNSWTLL